MKPQLLLLSLGMFFALMISPTHSEYFISAAYANGQCSGQVVSLAYTKTGCNITTPTCVSSLDLAISTQAYCSRTIPATPVGQYMILRQYRNDSTCFDSSKVTESTYLLVNTCVATTGTSSSMWIANTTHIITMFYASATCSQGARVTTTLQSNTCTPGNYIRETGEINYIFATNADSPVSSASTLFYFVATITIILLVV